LIQTLSWTGRGRVWEPVQGRKLVVGFLFDFLVRVYDVVRSRDTALGLGIFSGLAGFRFRV
jgi:hypothetical protein